MMHGARRIGVIVVALGALACGEPATVEDAGVRQDGAGVCASDGACDDGVFCNGAEACDPSAAGADARGCVGGAQACMPSQSCDEETDACFTACEAEPDADGDGIAAITCGGADCDDADRARYPGNVEICDPRDHDEDCDAATFGVRDADADGFADARCCNVGTDDMRACGNDCDDATGSIHPGLAESCDTFDNDCDGATDEGVQGEYHVDADGDGYGDMHGTPVMACVPPDSQHVANATDCDDSERLVNPATSELCDMTDNNCDGRVDEAGTRNFFRDADNDLFGDPDSIASLLTCTPPDGYVAIGNDCNDADPARHPGADELCDRNDSNCSLPHPSTGADGLEVMEDADGDGHAPAGTLLCSGGLPADDCDDTDASVHPLHLEICDGIDNDCDPDVDEGGDAWCGPAQVCAVGRCEGTVDIAAGDRFACSVEGDRVFCWGANDYGQLGFPPNDISSPAHTAREVPGLTDIEEIAAGAAFACARDSSGSVWCWGANGSGQLGDGTNTDRASPARVDGVTDAVSIRAGGRSACARRASGTLLCWGSNHRGQLGDGTDTDRATPTEVMGLIDVVQHDLGFSHACARLADGSLYCWGINASGQLGDGTTDDRLTPTRTLLPQAAMQVSAGYSHTCALTSGGRTFCWGTNVNGQLGFPSSTALTPSEVSLGPSSSELSTGTHHTCARMATGEVTCWGSGAAQLVGFTLPEPERPFVIDGVSNATGLAAGLGFTCARGASGITCWGTDEEGQLGDGGDGAPGLVTLAGASAVTLSVLAPILGFPDPDAHACAIGADGVYCWGANRSGELGDGTTKVRARPTPVLMMDGSHLSARAVSAGDAFTCALPSGGGTPYCWGTNRDGELGIGTEDTGSHPVPTPVVDVTDAVGIETGDAYACALRTNGQVTCWGGDDGAHDGVSQPPTTIVIADPSPPPSPLVVQVIALSGDHACGLEADGSVHCWDAGASESMAVAGLPGPALAIATGSAHDCAVLQDGRAFCWGTNRSGQLGDGTTTDRTAPVEVELPTGVSVVAISAGRSHTCARTSDGALYCWGSNDRRQLGDGSRTDSAEPIRVLDIDATWVVAENDSTCAIDRVRGALCWGGNSWGQLGRGPVRLVQGLP